MPTPALHNFIAIVPSCTEATSLADVLEIFAQKQCDRLVVVNSQESPLGVLYPARLIGLITPGTGDKVDLQQPLSKLGLNLVQVETLPALWSAEEFRLYLRSHKRGRNKARSHSFRARSTAARSQQSQPPSLWALVDQEGKFLGLLESSLLLRFLASDVSGENDSAHALKNSLLGLLERLPWPLMLQTGNGEVAPNQAWGRQFAGLSNPEAVRQEVEALLKYQPQAEFTSSREAANSHDTSKQNVKVNYPATLNEVEGRSCSSHSNLQAIAASSSCANPAVAKHLEMLGKYILTNFEEPLTVANSEQSPDPDASKSVRYTRTVQKAGDDPLEFSDAAANATLPTGENQVTTSKNVGNRCFLGTQPGTCICVVQVQSGGERVWEFVKIPLDASQLQPLSTPLLEASERSRNPNTTLQHLEFSTDHEWESAHTERCLRRATPTPDPDASKSVRYTRTVQKAGDNSQVDFSAVSPKMWLLVATDVTEQQQLASELAAKNADLIQLNRLKDEFLACISHELKTPLTAVLGLSSLLKDQLLGKLNDRQARYANLIHQSGRQLMSVVNDILDLTRVETGQLDLTLAPVQIAVVCDRAIEQAKAAIPENNEPAEDHRLTLVIEPGLDILIADEMRLRQMLVHLLANAFKFTEAGGEIGLRVSRWEGWIAFTVSDTGIGIPEHKQHLIFQKFQQLENPLTRKFQGTGLGLVITRALVRLHGGDVTFLSKEGKGSQFTLLLPPSPPPDFKFAVFSDFGLKSSEGENSTSEELNKSAPAKLKTQKLSNQLILVVETAPRFIEDLTEQLTSLGYPVAIARSGTEALEKARRLQPGIVFLNPLLPLLSGWDVLTLLKSDPQTCSLPVVITATRAEKDQAFSNRADGFLSLPVQRQALQEQLLSLTAPPVPKRHSDRLTILRLSFAQSTEDSLTETLGMLAQPSLVADTPITINYSVLEAEDLEQAEILARVWHPDVMLISGAIPNPVDYLQQLARHRSLKNLPLVTLDAETTQAASQVAGLSVFPCLIPASSNLERDVLLSVLQIAAGMSWKPNLLIVDFARLPDLPLPVPLSADRSKGSEWFQALIQYLQTAGLRGVMGRSWTQVMQQILQQSVDLLLIFLEDSQLHPGVRLVTTLGEQHNLPPILVLRGLAGDESEQVYADLDAIACQILPASLSMEELLTHINQALSVSHKHCDNHH